MTHLGKHNLGIENSNGFKCFEETKWKTKIASCVVLKAKMLRVLSSKSTKLVLNDVKSQIFRFPILNSNISGCLLGTKPILHQLDNL